MITSEVFNDMFVFLFRYVKNVLLLPGQIEQWVTICDLNNMSMTSLPRKQILAFGNLCQANLMYFLFRSFYTHVGWGQRLFYKGVQMFIDDETKLKIVLAADGAPEALVEMFHPSQLEKRFGGACETPTNFWPPHMGTEFIPENEVSEKHTDLISPDAYEAIIKENPELYVHPERLTPDMNRNRDFKLEGHEGGNMTQSSAYNLGTMQSEGDFPQTSAQLRVGSNMTTATMREGSIYHDALDGFDDADQMRLQEEMMK